MLYSALISLDLLCDVKFVNVMSKTRFVEQKNLQIICYSLT